MENTEGSLFENLPNDPKRAFNITNSAVAWLRQQVTEGRAFCLKLSRFAVHETAQSRADTLNNFVSKEKGLRHADTPFAALFYDMSESIRLLLKAIEKAGIDANTYIMFMSVNGSYSSIYNPSSANGSIRGHKDQIFEGSLRVPLIFSGPGIPAYSLSSVPVIARDVMSMILDLAKITSWPEKVVRRGSQASASIRS
tara:strand:+ start:798 stop:1388 length:591 start_codon:yes stop_codon:yes gene_type:complete